MKRTLSVLLMIFIVKWVAVEIHSTPCPQSAPYVDEYGITHQITSTTLQACYASSKQPMEKRFEAEGEADVFIAGMPDIFHFGSSGYVESVEKFKSEN